VGLTIRLARQASRDLAEIQEYLLPRSPRAAERIRLRVHAVIHRLAELPLTGRPTQNPDIRVVVLSNYPYLIYYAADDHVLRVLHIRHTARSPVDVSQL
jgi:plasmid stabilization system protein ParE